jgi:hypothetical protein
MQIDGYTGRHSPRKVSFELAKGMSGPARGVRSAMTRRPRRGDHDRGAEQRSCWERALKGRLRFEPGVQTPGKRNTEQEPRSGAGVKYDPEYVLD